MRISDWSSDVCSSDLCRLDSDYCCRGCQLSWAYLGQRTRHAAYRLVKLGFVVIGEAESYERLFALQEVVASRVEELHAFAHARARPVGDVDAIVGAYPQRHPAVGNSEFARSEEHTSELQSLMRIAYAVLVL